MGNSSARSVVEVGTVVADTYTVEALIGKGGMGAVYLASHKRLPGKQVAIKMLHADLLEPEVIARFKREAEIASRLGHPNIVGVTDFNITADGTPYLVLEYLEGESLSSRLRRGPLALETVFSIVRQVGSALAAAHREGIVHRDLKPGNIFLVPTEVDGKLVEIAKVLDFGISKMKGSTTVKTQESTLLGTPQYMAPEQARGEHDNVDARTDVFALGAIVYEMLAGHPAFSGETIPEVVFKVVYEQPASLAKEAPSAPAGVVATVNQAMMKSAAERFSSVSTFVEALTGEKVTLHHRPASMPPPDDGSGRIRSGVSKVVIGIDSDDISLDNTVAPLSPQTPPPAPAEPVRTSAPTVESIAPVSDPPSAVPAEPPPSKASWKLPVIAIGSAVAGAVVLYLVMRGESTTPAPADATRVASIDAAATIDAAPIAIDAVTPVDVAPVAIDAAVVGVADAAPAVADARIQPKVDAAVKTDDFGPGKDEVNRALMMLRSSNYAGAEQVANEVVNTPGSSPWSIANGHAIRGAVACLRDTNEERARIELRLIPEKFGDERAFLRGRCKKAGIDL